jgi:tripeptide aminopeptidase
MLGGRHLREPGTAMPEAMPEPMPEPMYLSAAAVRGHEAYARAAQRIRQSDAETVAHMRAVTGIAAPSGAEAERGRWLAERMRELGLEPATDEVGNVVAVAPGSAAGTPRVVVAAHLDTVFAADTDLTERVDNGRIHAPGISDNARGLAGMIALARGLAAAGWPTVAPVAFVATVGEEGAGDLRGAKHYMAANGEDTRVFVALDGAGTARIIHAGVGSRRLRATFTGPGGHSWSDWGRPNAVHAAGRAIAGVAALPLPSEPRTVLTVARMGGGTSINAIPAAAWIEIDMRSEQREPLMALEQEVRTVLQQAAAENSADSAAVTCDIVVIGDRPAGETAAGHPLVRLAEDATRSVGETAELTSSSTDANVAMAAGVPAIAIGAGGQAGGIHTLDEWYANDDGVRGIERALIVVLGAAGLS